MARKRKKGIKTYHPHNGTTFFYGLFALLLVGLYVAFFFLPMFNFVKDAESPIAFTGLDIIKLGLASFVPFFKGDAQNTFLIYFDQAHPTNDLLKIIVQFHKIIELVFVAFIALAAIFALFEFIFAILWFIKGKSDRPERTKSFAWLIFWFYALGIGLFYMYSFFYMQIAAFAEVEININFSLQFLIIIAGIFVLAFLINLIYHFYFKYRVAVDKKETTKTFEISDTLQNNEINSTTQAVANNVNNNANNNGITAVAGIVYARDKEITSAVVPEGVLELGSSAFANCRNLITISLPSSLNEIGFSCFFQTPKLTNIIFNGTIEQWKSVKRGSNWLMKSGTKTVQCLDGKIKVNPHH